MTSLVRAKARRLLVFLDSWAYNGRMFIQNSNQAPRLSLLGVVLLTLLTQSAAAVDSKNAQNPTSELRVVTYNIFYGKALDLERKLYPAFLKKRVSIARFLNRHSALKNFDILGLQEICEGRPGSASDQQEYFREILRAQGISPHGRFVAANPRSNDRCRSGQMILSRFPIVESGTFELPLLRPGGKQALWVDIEVPTVGGTKRVRVYNLHLDNRGKSLLAEKGRWKQIQTVLTHLEHWQSKNPDTPVIVLGDFNALNKLYNPWKREKTIREMSKLFQPSLKKYKATHITGHQLDWIFSRNLKLKKSRVAYKMLSDHFPVSADFEIKTMPSNP